MKYRAGDWVMVRDREAILATLDQDGCLDGMPFMPEMLRFCGQKFRIATIAHKSCDTVTGRGGVRLSETVHLENLRCDGAGHGGCQAACLLFWKAAWIQLAQDLDQSDNGSPPVDSAGTELPPKLAENTSLVCADGDTAYRCQATQLLKASTPLPWWDVRQYWRDVRSGNVSVREACVALFLACVFNLRRIPVGYRFNVWLYSRAHRLLRGREQPFPQGTIQRGAPTPDIRLGLQVGDIVRVRSKQEIEGTINDQNRNRGLSFDVEMAPYCGQSRTVVRRVDKIINERTGKMMRFENPCIVLDGVECMGQYSKWRLNCPRRITSYWREAWLERKSN